MVEGRWEDAVGRDDVDGVVIATPNAQHHAVAMAALSAGKHVLVDKPMACTVADADEMIAAAERARRVLVPFHNTRFAAPFAAAAQQVHEGAIGGVTGFRVAFGHAGPQAWAPQATWFFDRATAGGGCLIDLGVHAVDLVRAVTGDDVTHVSAVLNGQAGDVETDAQLLVRMRAGAIGSIHASWSARPGPDHQLTVVGTEGTLHLDSRTALTLVAASGRAQPGRAPRPDELAARGAAGRRARRARTRDHRSRRAGCDRRGRGRVPGRGDRRDGRGAVMLHVGFGDAVITPPTPVQLAGFIEDQPATEVHDDLEVRAMYLRGEHGAVCLVVCDLLGMSPSFARPVRESVAAALGLDVGAVLTSCVHTHAGPSTIAGSEALGWVTPEGYRELLVEQCSVAARAARCHRGARLAPRGEVPAADRVVRSTGVASPTSPTFAVLDAIAPDGSRVGTLANVCDPPGGARAQSAWRCRATGSAPSAAALQARAGGSTVLLSGALGDVNPHHVHRQHNDCRGDGFAEADQLGRDVAEAIDAVLPDAEHVDTAGPTVEKVRTLEVTMGETLLTSGQAGRPSVDRAGRVGDRSGAPRVGARRGVPRARPGHRAPRTARARCRPGARVARLPARCRSRTGTRSR